MGKIYSLLVLSFVITIAQAQQITFRTSYDIAMMDIPGNIIQNPQGNYVLAGTNTTFIPLYGNVTQLDTIGNVMWSKGYSAGSVATDLWDIKNVPGGGYIATGSTGSGLLLMRLDATGAVTWANRYNVSSGSDEHGQRVIPTSDGGFAVAGYVYDVDPDGGGPLARQDSANFFCLKVNASGALQWGKVFFVSTTFINDHVLNDVAEVSDGYIFTGRTSVSAVDDDGGYAVVLKTDKNGNLLYLKRFGSTSSEGNAITALSSNEVLLTGDDNSASFYLRFNSSGTINSGNKYSFGLINVGIPYTGYRTNDGQFAFHGMYIAPFSFTFASYLMKVNATNGNLIFSRGYNSGLSSILPEGTQASDSGFITVMTAQQFTGFNYHVVKTDKNGFMNNVNCDTTILTNPSRSNYAPTLTNVSPTELNSVTTKALSIIVANLNPTQVIECLNVPCTPPAAPTTSASPDTICVGQSTLLSASNSGNVTYKVYTQATGGTSIGNAPLNVSPTSTTTYYIEAESKTQPGCVSGRVPVTVTVNQAPAAIGSISGATTPCITTQTYSINAVAGATSYSWSVSGGGSIASGQGTTAITINWTTAGGPYTISVTASNACGSKSSSISVTVSAGVSGVTATATPNPICVGSTLTLSGGGNGVSTWSWTGPNGFTSSVQNPSISSISAAGSGIYTLNASSACGSGSATVTVTVNDKPTNVSASISPSPICKGSATNLSGTATNATSYSWSGPNGFSSTQQNPSISNAQPNMSGVYIFTATNACGSSQANDTLAVNEAPTALTATANPNPACPGSNVALSGASSGATSYAWSGPNSFSAGQLNATVNNIQQANTGVYTLSATNSCGTTTATVTLALANGPGGVSATANLTNICRNDTLFLSGNAIGATSFSWTGPNGFIATQKDTFKAPVTVADSGTYLFTAINACGNASAAVTVDVDDSIQSLQVSAVPNDTVCSGDTIRLSAQGSHVNNWNWSGPNGFAGTQSNIIITNATSAHSGIYIVSASNACGTLSDTLSVVVNTVPVLSGTISGTGTTCGTDTSFYYINAATSAGSYTWTLSGGGTILTGQGTDSVLVSWGSTAGSYTLSVTANNACGSSTTATITVQVLPPAPVMNSFITGDTSVCPGTAAYTISPIANATAYTWSIDGGGTIVNGQNNTLLTVDWSSAGSHMIYVTASNSCGSSDTASLSVTVHPAPTPATISLTGDTICEGSATTITATNATGGTVSYNFYDASTGGNIVGTSPLTVSPTSTTTYYLELINEFGCTGSAGRVPVTVYVIPAPSILGITAGNDTVCYNTTTTLTATATPGATVTWWDSELNGTQIGSGSTYTTDSLQMNTTYYAQATNAGGCQNLQGRVAVTVEVTPLPQVTLTSDKDNNTAFPAEAVTFTASPSGYAGYEFLVNGKPVQNSASNTWASDRLDDQDTVSVIAYDNGCHSVKTALVITIADFPNAFTPNGDNVNDVFLAHYDLVILNRWGQELYKGFDGWDGTYNGKKVSAGTYFYIVTLKSITDRDKLVKGTVLLIQE